MAEALPMVGSRGSTVLGRCRCCGEWGKPSPSSPMLYCRWCGEYSAVVPMTGRPQPGVSQPGAPDAR